MSSDNLQQGRIFSSYSKQHCKELRLGGGLQEKFFRGSVEHLKIWNVALSHGDILKLIKGSVVKLKSVVLTEAMRDLGKSWDWEHNGIPQLLNSDRIIENRMIGLIAPPCGKTICDVPDIVSSYSKNWQFQKEKHLK